MSVLLGNGDGSFQPPRAYAAGDRPVSLVAGDFIGNGKLDLAFAEAITLTVIGGRPGTTPADVSVLPGNGDGTFQAPVVQKIGQETYPQLTVGDFTGAGKPDLVVCDPSVSGIPVLVSNGDGTFSDPSQLAITPHCTPLMADVNGDRTDDLLVIDSAGRILYRQGIPAQPGDFEPPVTVNTGDGVLALFEGGASGLTLMSAQVEPDLPSPTALAFSALTGGQIQFYAATAGQEAADLVSLNLAVDTSVQVAVPGPSNTFSQLVSFEGSSVPLVATVLTLTIEVSASELSLKLDATENAGTGAFLSASGITVGQSLSSAGRGLISSEPADADEFTPGGAGPAHPQALPWERFVLGLDQVLERFMRENPNGLSGTDIQSQRPETPSTPGVPAQGNSTASPPAAVPAAPSGRHDALDDSSDAEKSKAVDSIIESLWDADHSRGLNKQAAASKRASDLGPVQNTGIPVVYSLESVSRAGDSALKTDGLSFGHDVLAPARRPPGRDEPSLLAQLAFAVLANEWAHSRLIRRSRRSCRGPAQPFREPTDLIS